MFEAKDILNITLSKVVFEQAFKNSFPADRLIDGRTNHLKKISEAIGESAFNAKGEAMIPQVFKKFKSVFKKGGLPLENFEKRELRALTYSLYHNEQNIPEIFSKPNELNFVFESLETSWKDAYLLGLIDCYLKNWESNYIESFEKLGEFIFKKLSSYKGERPLLKSFKENIRFFNGKNGDAVLGSELALKNKQVREATKYLLLPDKWFTYPYFSKVIIAYYDKRRSSIQHFLDDLHSALLEHQNAQCNLQLVSKLIIQANSNEFASIQDKVKSIAFKLVGDPASSTAWKPPVKASEQEKLEIKQAQTILNEWITREFITVFFDLIKEPRRKNYWKKFSKQINGFTIVGPRAVRTILLRDERIAEFVNPRFRVTESNRAVSAFIMRMKDYVLIEFSVSNFAFYALKENHRLIKEYENRRITSVEEFVDGTMPMLAKRKFANIEDENSEGRLFHRDGNFEDGSTLKWESVFDWWIKKYIEVNV